MQKEKLSTNDKQVSIDPAARIHGEQQGSLHEIAPDLAYQRLAIVNVIYYGAPNAGDRQWVLIDAGFVGTAALITSAAERRFGKESRPAAIILTHGHFDHVGALKELAERWEVQIYAHPLESPYLDGRSSYPPPDPTVGGGLMATLSRFYPRGPINISHWLQPLPSDRSVPGMTGWKWLHTPGHAPGHTSLWRAADRTLIAGDAFITTKQESAFAVATQRPELHGPPMYYTPDWEQARQSVERLAGLDPELVVTGHGPAMQGAATRQALHILARDFDRIAVPTQGRYVNEPARADEHGVTYVPPKQRQERAGTKSQPAKVTLKKLHQQVIVITGASSGIGLTTARMAAQQGARLVLSGRSRQALQQLTDEINHNNRHNGGYSGGQNSGQAVYVVADVSNQEEVREIAQVAQRTFGGFDTWVNNAGVGIFGKMEDTPIEDMRRLFETNFWGIVYGSLEAVKGLKQRGGALINLGSAVSDRVVMMQGIYSTSKHAVKGFTDALRMELEYENAPVSVTLIKPGAIDTPFPMNAKNFMDREATLPPPVYTPETVAKAILHSAENPMRDLFVGGGGKGISALGYYAPRLVDRMMESDQFVNNQKKDSPPRPRAHNGLERPSERLAQRGNYEGHVLNSSLYTEATMHPMLTAALMVGAGLLIAALLQRTTQHRQDWRQ